MTLVAHGVKPIPRRSVRCSITHVFAFICTKTDWSKRYAEADEIFEYIQDITEQYKIKRLLQIQS